MVYEEVCIYTHGDEVWVRCRQWQQPEQWEEVKLEFMNRVSEKEIKQEVTN